MSSLAPTLLQIFLMKHQGFQTWLLWILLPIFILKLDKSSYTHATAWMSGYLETASTD